MGMLPGRGSKPQVVRRSKESFLNNELPQAQAVLATAAFSHTEAHTVKADADLMEGRPTRSCYGVHGARRGVS